MDIRLIDRRREVSMDSYVDSLEEIPLVPGRKKKESLDEKELKLFCKATGKIGWLATNCRPDLTFNSIKMSMKGNDASVEDLKYANSVIKKAKGKVSKVSYKISKTTNSRDEDSLELVIYGMGDASYKAGEKAIGGQLILIGDKKAETVMPIFWKSKIIQKVCKSPKDAETINMGILADIARYTADKVEQLLSLEKDKKKVKVKLFTDSL